MPSSGASMHSNSMQSIGNQIGYKVRNIAHYGQPTIEINLDNSHGTHGGYVTSYSTMDTIEGTVSVTANHDTRFQDVEIAFIGTTQVFVDKLTTSPSLTGRTEANHRFLTLKQPIDEADLPYSRTLKAGKKYTFPFFFTIPNQLLPQACTHHVASDHVRNTHLMLPPSMGDVEVSGFGGTLLDDLAPEMSKIMYGIKVRITQTRDSDGSVSLLADKMRKVRVKPAFEEQPPLNVDPSNPEYRPRQEKTLKKGLFKGKLGTLTAQSAQPKALVIPGARSTNIPNAQITISAKVLLRFDPAEENNAPPRLGSLATKLKVSTFYASAPRNTFPARSSLGHDFSQGIYRETVSLSSLCIASAQWEKQSSAANPSSDNSILRRDSGISVGSMNEVDSAFNAGILTASKNYKGGCFYTTQILVPVALPNNKNFLPTFHNCLVSRTYVLSLQLSAHAPGVGDPSLHIKVPIQVCADGSDTGNENARARSAEAVVIQEAHDVFIPRSIAPPSHEVRGRHDLPPEYAAFAPQVGRYHARVTVVG